MDAVRDEGIWEQTKSAVAAVGGNVTIEVIKSLAIGFVKKTVEKQTGLTL